MRFLVMLAGFAAVLGVTAPAQADPGNSGPDASFLAALSRQEFELFNNHLRFALQWVVPVIEYE